MVLAFDTEPSKLVRLAREREERDQAELPNKGYFFAENMAQRAVDFFSLCKHWKGEWAGQSFELEPWQIHDIIRPLFGWYRPDGTRRFREAWIEVPRKNGKTTLVAVIGLYMLVADGEAGAEVYSAATKKDQAKIVHEDATQMVRSSPSLRKRIKVAKNNLHVQRLASKFEPLSSEENTLDGLNPHCVILDEVHRHRTRGLYDVLKTAMGARRQPLLVSVTTAGEYNPETIGWELHEHAEKVLQGALDDDDFFAYIAGADPDDDWRKPATWKKANPNYGVSVKEDYLREQAEMAARSPQALSAFLRFHLNIWVAAAQGFFDMEAWNKCDEEPPLTERQVRIVNAIRGSPAARLAAMHRLALRGRPAYGGLDLSSTRDLTAFVLLFPDDEAHADLLCRFWVPEDTILKRARESNAPYVEWQRDGWLTATPGNVVDYDLVMAEIKQLAEMYNIVDVGFDRWGMSKLQNDLAAAGIKIVETGQGYAGMSAPMKEFEKLYLGGRIHHAGHPVLRWNVANTVASEDPAENIKPDKRKSRDRIDGTVATIMAVDRWVRHTEDSDIYPASGLMVVGGGNNER